MVQRESRQDRARRTRAAVEKIHDEILDLRVMLSLMDERGEPETPEIIEQRSRLGQLERELRALTKLP